MSETKTIQTGVITPTRLKWHQRLAGVIVYGLAKGLSWTWRCHFHDESGPMTKPGSPLIYCLWHNRLGISMVTWHLCVKKTRPSAGLVGLISASKDGGLLAQVLKRFKVEAVRGSSSRRGRQALLEATSWIQRGYHIAITPDGPRGPKYQVQDGVLALAQVTGSAIIPVSSRIGAKWQLKNWDAFQIPLPFARCDIYLGKPIFVPRESTDSERESLRAELTARLMEHTKD